MAFHTIDIPRDEWTPALEAFGAAHDSWLITVEVMAADLGVQPEIAGLPLTGIVFEPRNAGAIVIAAGRTASGHVAHAIQHPTHVRVQRTEAGADAALEIESADGTKTILRFRAAAFPETVDGLARRR